MVGNQAVHSGKVTGKKPEEVEVERALLLEYEKRLKFGESLQKLKEASEILWLVYLVDNR